ncbi:competence protein CoiA family protein [Streptomyces sp. NPDC096136]|uniref:competence protein CoiA family protein n=1 Tax=Streptomyces sp. NPDC096136 TaxID=3366076 RepID=UPI003823CFF4
MPFTALHPEVGRIDSTQPDLGAGLAWSQVHKVSPRIALTCPECTWGVHAKHSPNRVRFFCHDAGRPPECSLANESWEHHMLKLEMAGAIRAAGWFAELEVAAADGSWRADVMATSPDGRQRIAWEAQLSPITVEDIQARTDRYAAEDIAVCWVSPHKRPPVWLGAVPSIRVRVPEQADAPWVVDDGLGSFSSGTWSFQEAELSRFTQWVLHGRLSSCPSLSARREVMRLVDGEHRWFQRSVWWTSRRSAEAQSAHQQERLRRAEAARKREEAARQRAEEARRLEVQRKEREAAARARRERWLATPAGQKAQQRQLELRRLKDAKVVEQRAAARRLPAQEADERGRRRAEARERRAMELAAEQEREVRRQLTRQELEQQAPALGEAWWARLSREEAKELFRAAFDAAWRLEGIRVRIPPGGGAAPSFAYGVPVHAFNRLYGIVRPCPALVPLAPQLVYHQVFARDATEVEALEANGLRPERVTCLDLALR